jgi:hypothetical protein
LEVLTRELGSVEDVEKDIEALRSAPNDLFSHSNIRQANLKKQNH